MFAVGQVVAVTTQRAGGFEGVSLPQPVLYCTLLSPLLLCSPYTTVASSEIQELSIERGEVDLGYELSRDGLPENLPTTISQEPEGAL